MGQFTSREYTYSDLDLDFLPHPTTGDIVRKSDEWAIIRSIHNLIYTNFYERPFQSYLGSGVTQLLFEPATPLTRTFLKNAIEEVIRNFEPRVRVDYVKIDAAFDQPESDQLSQTRIDENTLEVTIKFTILNTEKPVVTSLFLERIR